MNKNFSQIKTNVGAEVGDTSTSLKTLTGRFVNRRYFEILRAINWKEIRVDYTFNTVSGTQNYALPSDFKKEVACHDVTNDLQLSRYDLSELYRLYGNDIDTSGSIERYIIYPDVVQQQPTAASQLTIVSSAAGDTSQTILVRGISSSVEMYETVSLNGTTNAQTTNSYTRILGISKSAVTTGKVTITDGTNTLAVLAPEILESKYKLIKLHYIPTAVATIHLPYIKQPLPLSQDYDYPILDCADAIELGAVADVWRFKRQFAKAKDYENRYQMAIADLVWDSENEVNKINQFLPATFNKNNLY